MFKTQEKIILASTSPRRQGFLKLLGLKFKVEESDVDEEKFRNLNPKVMVRKLAYEKALTVAKKHKNAFVIGADTDVVFKGVSLGKPKNKKDAEKILKTLSGKTHEVVGAICLINISKNIKEVYFSKADVTFSKLTPALIKAYIDTKEGDDKAGAYAIQGKGGVFIKSMKGNYSTVIGLDIEGLTKMLIKNKVVTL